MLDFRIETEIFNKGCAFLGAIDEAGRGPLAGPVVAACVVLKNNFNYDREKFSLIRDSKKLSAKQRREAYKIIKEEFEDVGIGICGQNTIDKINILEATFLAMKMAVSDLRQKPDYVLIDGSFNIPNFSLAQKAIVKGDSRVFSIAASSVVAKVSRDELMFKYHEEFPQYEFAKHKGYGTKLHLEMLRKHGPCPLHRKSFRPVKKLLDLP